MPSLLLVAEAGFFPGILVFLNRWYPAGRRAHDRAVCHRRADGRCHRRAALGGVLEHFHDFGGLRGWQWMFVIEGTPVVLLGLVVLKCLPDSFERSSG
jgi:hypothetical protein